MGFSIRQAAAMLALHGRGYSIYEVQKAYKLMSFKPKTFKVKPVGIYDHNLQGYMEFFLRKKLHGKFNAKDLLQESSHNYTAEPAKSTA